MMYIRFNPRLPLPECGLPLSYNSSSCELLRNVSLTSFKGHVIERPGPIFDGSK